ncbi:MAG: M50 family metallopeptidase [candidate division WWE3 bacterium]|nr:M50 family metallopeptidase [candidate division WWE3 bacterium]
MQILITILVFLILFSIIIMFHELGHFLAARASGVLVEEFGWGFPPKIWGKKIGKTTYTINALPIGGFVRLYGSEFEKPNDPKAFWNQSIAKRLLVLSAGVVFNILLAAIFYYFILVTHNFVSQPIFLFNEYKFPFGQTQVYSTLITNVAVSSPAANAGLLPGDLVTAVNSHAVTTSVELNNAVAGKQGKSQVLTVKNISLGTTRTVNATPYYDSQYQKTRFGLELGEVAYASYNTPLEKAASGFLQTANIGAYTVKTLVDLVSVSVKTKSFAPVSENLTGPIGIAQIVGIVVQTSGPQLIWNLLEIGALLSLALGITNILPIPAMDGGHIAFVLFELITKRKPSRVIHEKVTQYGFYALIALSILIAAKDIWRLLKQ